MSEEQWGCAACAAYRDEIVFLRELVVQLQARAAAPVDPAQAPAPLAPGTTVIGPGGVILQVPAGAETEAKEYIGEHGEAMILVDGEQVPKDEYDRWKRGIDQAMAGKPIET